MTKKLLALFLCLTLILSFAACGKSDDEDEDNTVSTGDEIADESDLILPYSREDGVNPYKAESLLNQPVMPLMYEGLFALDESYQAQKVLASDIYYQEDSLVVEVDTKKEFSDGTTVDADDVVYSFKQATKSTYYGGALESITSAKAQGEDIVIFSLKEKNIFADELLTFPVVKAGTAGDETSIPVGTGRYVYEETVNGGVLKVSGTYSEKEYTSKQIYLTNLVSSSSLLYSLNIGNFDATFDDLSGGTTQRITASTAQVPLNHLVFIGVRESGALADAKARRYISDLLERDDLVSSGMDGYGDATNLPVNPRWYVMDGVKTKTSDSDKALSYLMDAFEDTTLTILTDEDSDFKVKLAEELSDQLAELGIKNEVKAYSYEQYKSAVNTLSYDLYIGEIRITDDMDITDTLDGDLEDTYKSFRLGDTEAQDFANAFYKEMPYIVIGFRNGILGYSKGISADVKPLPGSPYANVYEWNSRQD